MNSTADAKLGTALADAESNPVQSSPVRSPDPSRSGFLNSKESDPEADVPLRGTAAWGDYLRRSSGLEPNSSRLNIQEQHLDRGILATYWSPNVVRMGQP